MEYVDDVPMVIDDLASVASQSLMSNFENLPTIYETLLNPNSVIYHDSDSVKMEMLLQNHGIPVNSDHQGQYSVEALIHHLVNGLCVYKSNGGCQSVVACNTVSNLGLTIYCHILNAPLSIIRILGKSLGY